jgi:stage V sporulation protein B
MAMLGLTLGVAVSCGYLIVCRTKLEFRDGDASLQGELSRFREVESRKVITKQLLSLAIPITLSGSVLSITKIADMTLILHRLQDLGQKPEQASALYGIYTTITVPVFNLIPSLLGSIALALIPTLSAAIEAKNIRAQSDAVHTAMRLTTLLSVPASFALAVYSRPIVSLLFSVQGEELVTSARLLSILAASVAFSGLITTTNAILQAYGKTKLPIISMLIGSGIKLLTAVFLIGRPSVHIYGAPVSTLLCNSVIVGINLYMIAKHSGVFSSLWGLLFSPMLLSLPSVGIPALLFSCLLTIGWSEKAAFILMVPLTIVLLLVLSLKSGMLEIQELESIANGKLYRMLDRYLHFLLPKKE